MLSPRIHRGLPLLALLVLTASTRGAFAQLPEVPLIVRNARILSPEGTTDELTIVCGKGRVRRIAKDVELPLFKRVVDAKTRIVTAGFIDVSSSLAISTRPASSNATQRAEDAFDRYAVATIEQALRAGVTTVYLSSRGSGAVSGRGAVVRLERSLDGAIGSVLASGALHIDLGSTLSAIARIRAFDSIRKQFQSAREYRRSLDDYDEALAEYVEKLKERAEADEKAEKKAESSDEKSADRKGAERKNSDGKKPAGKESSDDDAKKKDDEPKKPRKPRRNAGLEVLLEALDRKIPVRITAHRSEDILNAIELAGEFELDHILVGASEAHLVLEEISPEVPVVLDTRSSNELPGGAFRSIDALGGELRGRGCETFVGSGESAESRFLPLLTELDGRGSSSSELLARVTSKAAKLLGVEKDIGAVRRGLRADLVVWSGDPFDPDTRVEVVIVGGRIAYQREEETP